MAMVKIGIVKAHIPGVGEGEGLKYVPVGVAFKDDKGRTAVKLNTLPIDKRWQGWLNIFDDATEPAVGRGESKSLGGQEIEDDIPF